MKLDNKKNDEKHTEVNDQTSPQSCINYNYLPRTFQCLQLFTHPDFEILNFQAISTFDRVYVQQSISTFTAHH